MCVPLSLGGSVCVGSATRHARVPPRIRVLGIGAVHGSQAPWRFVANNPSTFPVFWGGVSTVKNWRLGLGLLIMKQDIVGFGLRKRTLSVSVYSIDDT